MSLEKELKVAVRAVAKASALCEKVQKTLCDDETVAKKDRSPVTIADFGSQALVIADIRNSFPHDPIVGEEDAAILRENAELRGKVHNLVSEQNGEMNAENMLDNIDYGAADTNFRERYWTLDPIDGTKGFLRGDQYAIALALVENGQVVLGVLGCPNLPLDDKNPQAGQGCLLYAIKDEGAFQKPLHGGDAKHIFVNGTSEPQNAWFCESVEKGHSKHDVHERIGELLGISKPPYRIDSQCKYAVVARGGVPIYLRLARGQEYKEKIWDHAAGSFIVKEAGGEVTDFSNNELDFSIGRTLDKNTGILATNGLLHKNVLEAIRKALAD